MKNIFMFHSGSNTRHKKNRKKVARWPLIKIHREEVTIHQCRVNSDRQNQLAIYVCHYSGEHASLIFNTVVQFQHVSMSIHQNKYY